MLANGSEWKFLEVSMAEVLPFLWNSSVAKSIPGLFHETGKIHIYNEKQKDKATVRKEPYQINHMKKVTALSNEACCIKVTINATEKGMANLEQCQQLEKQNM